MEKNTGESLREAYGKDLEDNKSDLYADMNKENAQKSALKEEQKKAKEAYGFEFQNREKILGNEKNDLEIIRQKEDAEKEKRVEELKEKEEFGNAYKRQFGEENNIDTPRVSNIDTPVSNASIDNETDLQRIIRERNENMPDKIGDELIDNDLKERAAKILATGEYDAETQRKMINKQDKRIDDLSVENEQLEKFFEIADKRLDAMKNEVEKQIEEVKNPTLKDAIINFIKKPKVKGAIVFGLAGAAVYAASGGTAVPVYFAVKAALATVGVDIFVPAAVGHGLSTWGTAAIAGGATGEFASYLSKKLGLSKGEKSDKEKHQEGLENLKNIANGQQSNTSRQEGQSQVENNTAQDSEPEEQKPKKKSFWKRIIEGGNEKEENIEQQPEVAVEPKKSTEEEEGIELTAQLNNIDNTTGKKSPIIDLKAGITLNGDKGEKSESSPYGEEKDANKKNDSEYMEIVKRESEIYKKFVEDFKNNKKTGKDVFDYLAELSTVYFKDRSKYITVFYAEVENQEKLSVDKPDELKINLIDSMIDYLREERKEDQKLIAKQFTTLLFPWSGAKVSYSYAGKKENVEWLGWKYKAL